MPMLQLFAVAVSVAAICRCSLPPFAVFCRCFLPLTNGRCRCNPGTETETGTETGWGTSP